MTIHELHDPHHVTAGFVGQPGERVFYLQAQQESALFTVQLEKAQVSGLAELLGQLLARVDDAPATDWDRDAMALRDPVEPQWRVGDISVGLEPTTERFVVELEQAVPDDDAETLRIVMLRDQARRLAAHAAEQVEQGRPVCPLCSRPMAVDGAHTCPATNGHGPLT